MRETENELGITEKELRALKKVRDGLAAGRYVHLEDIEGPVRGPGLFFNMRYSGADTEYGTVACIGGWMSRLLGRSPIAYVDDENSCPLNKLFFPYQVRSAWSKITPKQAVKAINNFLCTGHPKWREVCK